MIYWFNCPECETTWESDNSSPESEWCWCNSSETPELFYTEAGSLNDT